MKDTVDPQIAKQIRALDMKYDEAFNKNDAAAVAARFTEDAVQVAPEGVFFGRQAIEKRYAEQVFQQWHCNNHITKTKQVIAVGNEICSVGEWSCNARDSDGSTKQVNGYLSTVFGRDGDTWKTRMTTFNLVPPAETKSAQSKRVCGHSGAFGFTGFRLKRQNWPHSVSDKSSQTRKTDNENTLPTYPYRIGNQLCLPTLSQQKDTVDSQITPRATNRILIRS